MYKKPIAIVLALLFIMQMLSMFQNVGAIDTGKTVDLKLYLHDNNNMDTDNTGMGAILFGSGGTASFETVSLEKDMTMIAYEDGGEYGFWSTVYFNKGPLEDTTWRLTVVYDNSTIAETTYTITGTATSGGGNIFIPFTEPDTTQYVFSKDKVITFEIQLQSGNAGTVQGSGENSSNSANLRLKVNYLTHHADTYNKDEKTKQKNWTPNLPDGDKKIVIKGSIQDAFSSADFKETDEGDDTDAIIISIENPSGDEIHNDTISKNDNDVGENKSIVKDSNKEYDYRYVFDYSGKDMSIGTYVISVYVNTKQHTFKTTTNFTISEYGILISAIEGQDEDESTTVVELFTAQKKEKELSLNITNTGSKNGDVKVSKQIIDETGGWTENDIKLSDEDFQLSAGDNQTIIATFTPPTNARPEDFVEAKIKVELSVSNSVKASSEIYVYVEVVKSYSLNLVAETTIHIFSPNEVYTFQITVENNGGENDTYNFTSEQISGWKTITPEPQRVEVQAGKEYKYLKVKVEAPDFSSDDEYAIKIKGDNGKDGAKKATAELTLTIKARIGIKISVDHHTEDVDVETNKAQKTFYVKIENTDDENHDFQLSSSISPSSSDLSVNMLTELNLSAGTSQTINVNVVVDKGAKAGNYNITITGKIKGESKTVKDFINVNVKKYYKLEISLKGGEEKVKPGDEVRYTLNIKNLGNTKDTFTILPQSTWVVMVDKNSITIDAGENADINIKITAPKTAKSGEKTEITVEVKSVGNDKISETEKFTLTIEKGMAEKLVDTLKDAWYFFILLIAVFILFAYVQKQRKQVNK